MRLIDADALANALFEKRKNYPQWVADTIGNMPTIDAIALLKEYDTQVQYRDDHIAEYEKEIKRLNKLVKEQEAKQWK